MFKRNNNEVTLELFRHSHQNVNDRIDTLWRNLEAVDERRQANREALQREIDQAENARAADKRTMVKAAIGAAATLLATIAGFVLSLITDGGII